MMAAPSTPPLNRTLLALSLGTGLSLIGDTSLYTVLPVVTVEAGVTTDALGVLLSANRWVRLAANPGAGWLGERISLRRLFVLAVFLGSLSTGIYAFTTGFWPLLAGRLLWGLSWSGIWVTGNAIALDAAPRAKRGRIVGLYHMSFFIGAGLGAPIGGTLTAWLGYRPAMAIAAALTFAGAAAAWLLLPEPPAQRAAVLEVTPLALRAKPPPPVVRPRLTFLTATAVLATNRLLVAGILLSTFSFFLAQRFGDPIIVAGRSLPLTFVSGTVLGAGTLLSVMAPPVAGQLSDRLQQRWLVVGTSLLLGTIGFWALTASLPWLVFAGLPLIFLSSGGNQGLATALVGDAVVDHRRGRALGIFYTAGDVASAAGPMLAYGLINLGLPAAMPYGLAAGLALATAILTVFTHSLRAGALPSNVSVESDHG